MELLLGDWFDWVVLAQQWQQCRPYQSSITSALLQLRGLCW